VLRDLVRVEYRNLFYTGAEDWNGCSDSGAPARLWWSTLPYLLPPQAVNPDSSLTRALTL